MAQKMNIWFDKDGDFLEITTSNRKGFFRPKKNDIFERVDTKGNIIGFAIFNFSKRTTLKEERVELPFQFTIRPIS